MAVALSFMNVLQAVMSLTASSSDATSITATNRTPHSLEIIMGTDNQQLTVFVRMQVDMGPELVVDNITQFVDPPVSREAKNLDEFVGVIMGWRSSHVYKIYAKRDLVPISIYAHRALTDDTQQAVVGTIFDENNNRIVVRCIAPCFRKCAAEHISQIITGSS